MHQLHIIYYRKPSSMSKIRAILRIVNVYTYSQKKTHHLKTNTLDDTSFRSVYKLIQHDMLLGDEIAELRIQTSGARYGTLQILTD